MIELPKGRVSGKALRALVSAVRKTPARHVVAKVLRKELGIDALRELSSDARGALPFSLAPIARRRDHARPSLELGTPTTGEWPRTAAFLARQIREGVIDCEELASRSLAAARELASQKPSRGPLLDFDDARAHRAAKEATTRIREGRARGVLDGIPIAIKEEVAVQGLPLRVGTAWMDGAPAVHDSAAVRRLREAGAVVIGTTPMTEYGMSPLGANVHRVMPRNAHHAGRLPGGSSSGSGVAVATGVVPVALGADGGGSIRIPAALNGIFGLKPTFGRIPLVGLGVRGGSSVVHLGPLGASTYDLALFLEASSGPDDGDLASLAQPRLEIGDLVGSIGRGVRGLRIGILDDEWSAAPSEIARAGKDAVRGLEREGAVLVSVGLELAKYAAAIGYLTIGLEFFTNSLDVRRAHMDELGLDVQMLLANLETFRADDYIDAQKLRDELRRQVAHLFDRVDVLALPTTATTAPPIDERDEREGFVDPPALDAICRYAFLGNLTGIPGGTAPIGLDRAGLPIGLQILGDAWDEAVVIQTLAHLERAGIGQVVRPESAIDLMAK